jgi:hypothetical protein
MEPSKAFRESQEKRRDDYEERRKKAEQLLDGAENMQEYGERRKALHSTIIQPEIPLDEMSMSDYLKARKRQ